MEFKFVIIAIYISVFSSSDSKNEYPIKGNNVATELSFLVGKLLKIRMNTVDMSYRMKYLLQ